MDSIDIVDHNFKISLVIYYFRIMVVESNSIKGMYGFGAYEGKKG